MPAAERALFVRDLQQVAIKSQARLLDAGDGLPGVYFPTGAVISALCISGGAVMDVHGVGREGMLGSDVLLGIEQARFDLVCQIGGTMLHMPRARFREHLLKEAGLQQAVTRYAFDALTLMGQSVACIASHNIPERCARWLLITSDRVGSLHFDMTHALLSRMLGVRRSGVSVALSRLQNAGLIQYRLGRVRIEDKRKLEEKSCECYRAVVRETTRFAAAQTRASRSTLG
jgi:CRP-like cAMP-binding protein